MAYSYLTEKNVIETFRGSRQYTEALTSQGNSFIEYERIARNKPHSSIPKEYPRTTDGTTASIIRKTPHRIIQQLPTGRVISDKEDWLTVVASFIYSKQIIPKANEGYALLQKCWTVVEKFLTFGYCPTYAPFVEHGGYFCTDLRLPYWGDIFVQPGKLSDADSNYMFMRSWWQSKDIEALIDSQSKVKNTTWNIANLKAIKDVNQTKDIQAQTPIEREKAVNTKGGVELITGFQRGIGAKFFTFHVASGLIVRTKVNKDPRGELPISFAYGDIDGSNPFGRSIVDLVGPLQNLIDGEMQMYQYNRALMLNPPLIKLGNFNKNNIKFAPNTIIDVGSDPNAKVEPLTIDTTAIANHANNYGLLKSQLYGLLSSPNTDVSATVSGGSNSKTPQGVTASQAALSIDDNYVRQQFETWFARWSETAINLYFAEREGIEELQLDDDTVQELQNLPEFAPSVPLPDGTMSPPGPMADMLSPDGVIRINYSSATPALKFRVDAQSSKMTNDPAQVGIATTILDTVMKFPMLNKNFGGRIDVDELAEKIVKASGIQNPELIAPEPTAAEKQSKQASKQQPSGFSPLFDKPKIVIDYKDVEDPGAREGLLKLAGAPPSGQLLPTSPGLAEQAARGVGRVLPEEPNEPSEDPNAITPDHILQAHDQAHQQEMDKAKLMLEVAKAQQQGEIANAQHQLAKKQANKPVTKKAGK